MKKWIKEKLELIEKKPQSPYFGAGLIIFILITMFLNYSPDHSTLTYIEPGTDIEQTLTAFNENLIGGASEGETVWLTICHETKKICDVNVYDDGKLVPDKSIKQKWFIFTYSESRPFYTPELIAFQKKIVVKKIKFYPFTL